MLRTTMPSDLRTPPQLLRTSSRYTPRASNALPREISRRVLEFFAAALRLVLGRPRSASSHNATTPSSPSVPALVRSCSISRWGSLSMRSRVHTEERRPLNAVLAACMNDPFLKDSEARDQQGICRYSLGFV